MCSRYLVTLALFVGLIFGPLEQLETGRGCTCGPHRACAMSQRPKAKSTVPPCHAALGLAAEPSAEGATEELQNSGAKCELRAGCCQRNAQIRAAERPSEAPMEPLRLAVLMIPGALAESTAPGPVERVVPPPLRPPNSFPVA